MKVNFLVKMQCFYCHCASQKSMITSSFEPNSTSDKLTITCATCIVSASFHEVIHIRNRFDSN